MNTPRPAPVAAVVFDLGGVLIDWDPRRLFRRLIAEEAALEHFLSEICPLSWNLAQDAGTPLAHATAERAARFPAHAELIHAYYGRWEEMLAGPIAGSVALLRILQDRAVPLYSLTNFSAELFPIARRRFDFLGIFRGIVVSGEEGLVKPDPAIYRLLLERFALRAETTLFIDDNPDNVATAADLGFQAHRFAGPASLAAALADAGLIGPADMPL